MLAFSLLTFPSGYAKQAGLQEAAQNQIIWGADYLLKTVRTQGAGYSLIYQVSLAFWPYPRQISKNRSSTAVVANTTSPVWKDPYKILQSVNLTTRFSAGR